MEYKKTNKFVLELKNFNTFNNDFNHIKYLKKIIEKKEKTEIDNQIIFSASKTFVSLKKFLNDKRLSKSQILGKSFNELNNAFFEESYWIDNNNTEKIVYLKREIDENIINKIESNNEDLIKIFNTLLTFFYFRINLASESKIGVKVYNNLFLMSILHFSFELYDDKIPSNEEIYYITLVLGILSYQQKNFSIENINSLLNKIYPRIHFQFKANSILRFYSTRFYG